jgi:hypothetical protein
MFGPGPTTSRNGKLINRLSRVQICLTIFHGVIEGVAVGNIYECAAETSAGSDFLPLSLKTENDWSKENWR